jgi:hypothetical protein
MNMGNRPGLLRYRHTVVAVCATVLLAWTTVGCGGAARNAKSASQKTPARQHELAGYFDAHNHGYNGILPYYAFADPNAFIHNPADPAKVDLDHRRKLWAYLVTNFAGEGRQPPLTGPGNRIAPGAIATLRAYGNGIDDLTEEQINGALERVLTSTPWTEFDSAYAFRSAISSGYLPALFSDSTAAGKALCDASILALAVTHTAYSEQFLSFVGGWGNPASKLAIIRCFMEEPAALASAGQVKGMPVPEIKVLFMTHTSELGATDNGQEWMEFASDPAGQCVPWQKPPASTSADEIRQALLGKDSAGNDLIEPNERAAYLNDVVGIDTAGPEITCFTSSSNSKDQGMDRYKALVRAVYSAAKERRSAGWHGKLLVHTHVGEGGTTYLIENVPSGEAARFIFKSFPAIRMDPATGKPAHVEHSARNMKLLLKAVEELKSEISDLDDYIVFRFGHVTNADMEDALAMKRLGIEADINLESNISTGAYYLPELRPPDNSLLTERQQFEYNDLPARLLASGHADELLSRHAFKYMLQAGVRTLMGSDGEGEEDSNIGREYKMAGDLIQYWKTHDDKFPRNVSVDVLYRNVKDHLADMASDKRLSSSHAK